MNKLSNDKPITVPLVLNATQGNMNQVAQRIMEEAGTDAGQLLNVPPTWLGRLSVRLQKVRELLHCLFLAFFKASH